MQFKVQPRTKKNFFVMTEVVNTRSGSGCDSLITKKKEKLNVQNASPLQALIKK